MAKKLTHKKYSEKFYSLNDNLKLLSKYKYAHKPVTVICKICQNKNIGRAYRFIERKDIYPYCNQKHKLSNDEYINKLKGRSIVSMDTFINLKQKTKHQCLVCDYIWYTTPYNIIHKNSGCPKCVGLLRKTNNEFVSCLKSKNNTITCLDSYINNHTKLSFVCNICQHKWKTTPDSILNSKSNCPVCIAKEFGSKRTKTHDTYVKELRLKNPNIICLETYIKCTTKILHQCRICNRKWKTTPVLLLSMGSRCICEKQSKGESEIIKYLKDNNFEYIEQHKYDDLFYKSSSYPLSFDFFLPKHNLLIEYNGKQHYESQKFFGGEDTFKHQVIRDGLKHIYCKKNNIKLLVIKYNESVENILTSNKFNFP